ncbi:Translin-associated protein X [Vanrija pseudolonga]|uniref:Translin-associated protein X n=1 Tax=Vanrija pseudolonga TaxID=143232 RepID=A0AAF1BLB7_9TREE|nr:Translin-associated protein X [Vanrija pseudolonga]
MADIAMASAVPDQVATMSRREHLSKTFEVYRAELDAYNERREKIIIVSRAITQLSKKLIFHLHRGATAPAPARAKNLKEARAKEREIWNNFVAIRNELAAGSDDGGLATFWRFNRQVAGGLEEFIEGYSFLYYLETGELVSLEHLQEQLTDSETGENLVVITPEDYVLGMSDLTGELMRYATNALSTGDHDTPLAVCNFVRTVKTLFDVIPESVLYKLKKKQEETTRSLEKIEKVCYALRLRLVEFGDKPEVLRAMAKRALDEANMSSSGGGGATEARDD